MCAHRVFSAVSCPIVLGMVPCKLEYAKYLWMPEEALARVNLTPQRLLLTWGRLLPWAHRGRG